MSTIVRNVQLGSPAALPSKTRLSLAEGIPFNEWREIGEQLERVSDSSLWWVADWAAYGDRWYRKDYGPALEQIWARKSLQNLASVARQVEPSRRREGLTFTHHACVASLTPAEQDDWLDDAERQGWSMRELREELQRARGVLASVPTLSVKLVEAHYHVAMAAAEKRGMDPRDWVLEQIAIGAEREGIPLPQLEAA
jgi:hypothetical protein